MRVVFHCTSIYTGKHPFTYPARSNRNRSCPRFRNRRLQYSSNLPSPSMKDITMANTFGSQGTLTVDNQGYLVYRLAAVNKKYPKAERLPFSLKILLENLLRT